MGLFAGIVGAASGFGISVMANATMKIPLSRAPWNHVAGSVFGFWLGNYYVKLEKQLSEDINEIRADKGLPPMVGTTQWIRYSAPKVE